MPAVSINFTAFRNCFLPSSHWNSLTVTNKYLIHLSSTDYSFCYAARYATTKHFDEAVIAKLIFTWSYFYHHLFVYHQMVVLHMHLHCWCSAQLVWGCQKETSIALIIFKKCLFKTLLMYFFVSTQMEFTRLGVSCISNHIVAPKCILQLMEKLSRAVSQN